MTAGDLVQWATWAGLLAVATVVLLQAVRRPRRSTIDAALLFGVIGALVLVAVSGELIRPLPEGMDRASPALLMTLPYLVVRLADDFVGVPRLVLRLVEVGLVLAVLAALLAPQPFDTVVVLGMVAYFTLVQGYATSRFLVGARYAVGVVRRRLQAVAAGSGFLAMLLLLAGVGAVWEPPGGVAAALGSIATLGIAGGYFLGFATPRFAKRGWQAPELERLLDLVATLSGRDLPVMAARLETSIAQMLGVPQVTILKWDDGEAGPLQVAGRGYDGPPVRFETTVAAQAHREQTSLLVEDSIRHDPQNADVYRHLGARTVLAAPLSTPDRHFGVIVAYGARASPFAEDDLALLTIVGRQVAVALRNQELMAEQASVRAREEATQLKDEFLSAAAHELKTPLTTLVGQTQLMQRRAARDAKAPVDVAGLARLGGQAERMRRLVENLLDASWAEQVGFVAERTAVNLLELAREVASTFESGQHPVEVGGDLVFVSVDRHRMDQVIANLLDNAMKYSPPGARVQVQVVDEGDRARLVVSDEGTGVAAEDRELIFERFQRGSGTEGERVTGLGLGLYLVKRIVEGHGGEVSVERAPGGGSAFTVVLPREQLEPREPVELAHPHSERNEVRA